MKEVGTLELHRFNGVESYEIKTAEINVASKNGDEHFMLLSLSAPKAIKTLSDTTELGGQPEASISLFIDKDWNSELVAGSKFLVPNAYDEKRNRHVVEFSYVSFEDLYENTIQILEREIESVQVLWQGRTQDMNFYDGSKPDAKFIASFWARIVN